MNCNSGYYWHVAELDAAIIQREEYLMRGTVTTNLEEVAGDIDQFLQTQYIVLPKNAFFVNGSNTRH